MTEDLIYKIAVGLLPKIGPVLAKRLIAYCGSIEGVFKEKKANLAKVPGIGTKIADLIVNHEPFRKAEKEIEYIVKNKIEVLFYLDEQYPCRLKECEDAPLVLFYKGNCNFNAEKSLSIVGTRNATSYGKEVCENIIKEIAEKKHNVLIISGLAYGIDITAHKSALSNNMNTIAVLGHGLKIIYPKSHTETAKAICTQGAIVTEFLYNEIPEPQNFVKRNRIIAGLADATIVVESDIRGGALITADIANSYNRDVFAVPGRINNRFSSGPNKLIKTNRAALIESAEDIEYMLGWDSEAEANKPEAFQPQLFTELSNEEKDVLAAFNEEKEMPIDQLSYKIKLPLSKLSYVLIQLEFKGLIKCLPGKTYKTMR